jgi:hypothetical protein
MSDLQIRFTLTERDLVRVNRVMLNQKRDTRALYLFALLGMTIACGSMIVRGFKPLVAAVLVATVIAVASLWASPWLEARKFKGHATAFLPQEWTLSPSGVTITVGSSRSDVAWADLKRVAQTRDYLMFYVSDEQAVPVPKRAIPEEQLSPLREALMGWLGAKANL